MVPITTTGNDVLFTSYPSVVTRPANATSDGEGSGEVCPELYGMLRGRMGYRSSTNVSIGNVYGSTMDKPVSALPTTPYGISTPCLTLNIINMSRFVVPMTISQSH